MNSEVIIRILLNNRKPLVITWIASLLLGITIAMVRPSIYHSQARFITKFGSGQANNLSKRGLARISKLAGLNFGGDDDQFDPALLQDIVFSRDLFQHVIAQIVPVNTEGDSIKFLEYYLSERSGIFGKQAEDSLFELGSPPIITKKYEKTIESFYKKIEYDLDLETGVYEIGYHSQNPVIAQSVTHVILKYIENFVTNFQLEKKLDEVNYLNDRKSKSLKKYELSGLKIADFLTKHQDIYDEKVKFEYEKLKNDHAINYEILMEVSSQLEFKQFELEEKKPIIYLIEEPGINVKPITWGVLKTSFVCLFLSTISFVLYVLRNELIDFFKNI